MKFVNYMNQLPSHAFGVDTLLATIGVTALVAVLIVWTVAWKGAALWKAARHGSKWWFILLLLVNTVGILDIIYIYAVDKRRK
jgi:hypothetical protein